MLQSSTASDNLKDTATSPTQLVKCPFSIGSFANHTIQGKETANLCSKAEKCRELGFVRLFPAPDEQDRSLTGMFATRVGFLAQVDSGRFTPAAACSTNGRRDVNGTSGAVCALPQSSSSASTTSNVRSTLLLFSFVELIRRREPQRGVP
jgi:hypothetical protein